MDFALVSGGDLAEVTLQIAVGIRRILAYLFSPLGQTAADTIIER